MHKSIKELLECPSCRGELEWNILKEDKERIIDAEILCKECGAKYEVRDEIAVFLTPDLYRNDLWEKGESQIGKFFKENKDVLENLINTEVDDLNGADLWYLASYYEINEDFDKSIPLFEKAFKKVYAPKFLEAWENSRKYIIDNVKEDELVVDIASGKGYLIKEMLERIPNKIVATDFSPTILIRNKKYFKKIGLYDNLSLMSFDARRTPFKKESVDLLTSNIGLSNVENSGKLAEEIYRIVKDRTLFYFQFLDESDQKHMDLLKKYGVQDMNVKSLCSKVFDKTKLKYTFENSIVVKIEPTPVGEIVSGAEIDGIPIHPVNCECTILHGKRK